MAGEARTWEDLGRAVRSARLALGFSNSRVWAMKVGRTDRVLLGLERGEAVGPNTLALVENALGKAPGWAHRFMAGAEEEVAHAEVVVVVEGPKESEVLDAIRRDPHLLPEARAHLLNQYELLRRLGQPSQAEKVEEPVEGRRLKSVARGRTGGRPQPDDAVEVAFEEEVRAAVKRNPHARKDRDQT
jgi:hypothetical protein